MTVPLERQELVLYESNTALTDVLIGTQVMLGGLACGLAVSALVYVWLRFAYNDPATQHTLVLVGAFTAFYVGEGLFHVSGVLATLVLGLFMSYRGKYMLGPRIEQEGHVIVSEVRAAGTVGETSALRDASRRAGRICVQHDDFLVGRRRDVRSNGRECAAAV